MSLPLLVAIACGLTMAFGAVTAMAEMLAGGREHTCRVTDAGAAECWGEGIYGELGHGSMSNSPVPVQVVGLNSGVTEIDVDQSHSCAIVNGGARCWGLGGDGQLGHGATANSSVPVIVIGLSTGVTDVDVSPRHTCAVVAGGAECWGWNGLGQLGDGSTSNTSVPVDVSGLTSGVTKIGAGSAYSCALVSSTVRCWGLNDNGQLGNGSTEPTSLPTDVTGITSAVSALAVGHSHACATVSGGVKCWGYNFSGQLGKLPIGAGANSLTPVDVTGITSGVSAITAGNAHTCAIVNGGAKCWGVNSNGQLGSGATGPNTATPVAVTGLSSGVLSITAGWYHTCATTVTGSKCWGQNSSGQLGDGTTINSPPPVNVLPPVGSGGSPGGGAPGGGTPAGPPTVTFKLQRNGKPKFKRAHMTVKLKASFTVPPGVAAAAACNGLIRARAKPKGLKKAANAKGKLAVGKSTCLAKLTLKLPRKFRKKRVAVTLSFTGNSAVAASSGTIRHKIR